MDPQRQVEALIDDARRATESAREVEECRLARELSAAARRYAQGRGIPRELAQKAACLLIEAEQKLGQALAELGLAKAAPGNQYSSQNLDRTPRVSGPQFLSDLKIPKKISRRSQLLANVSPTELRSWMLDEVERGKLPTLKAAVGFAKAEVTKAESVQQSASDAMEAEPESYDGPLIDLLEHQKMLDRLLRRVYHGGTITFTEAQGRLIKRYVSEIATLARELCGA